MLCRCIIVCDRISYLIYQLTGIHTLTMKNDIYIQYATKHMIKCKEQKIH